MVLKYNYRFLSSGAFRCRSPWTQQEHSTVQLYARNWTSVALAPEKHPWVATARASHHLDQQADPKTSRMMTRIVESNASMDKPETDIAHHSARQTTRSDQMLTDILHPAPEQPTTWQILTQWTIARCKQLCGQRLRHSHLFVPILTSPDRGPQRPHYLLTRNGS